MTVSPSLAVGGPQYNLDSPHLQAHQLMLSQCLEKDHHSSSQFHAGELKWEVGERE